MTFRIAIPKQFLPNVVIYWVSPKSDMGKNCQKPSRNDSHIERVRSHVSPPGLCDEIDKERVQEEYNILAA